MMKQKSRITIGLMLLIIMSILVATTVEAKIAQKPSLQTYISEIPKTEKEPENNTIINNNTGWYFWHIMAMNREKMNNTGKIVNWWN